MNILLGVLVGLLVLMFLVTAHEFGHFIMARKNGVTVKEFGIGFPPRAIAWVKKNGKWVKIPKKDWGKEQKSLVFSLNWLPIGGFCTMDGESDADKRPGTFGAASFWKKTKILFGGVAMNWLVAFLILTVLAWTGMPKFIENQFFMESDVTAEAQPVVVEEVFENTPAAEAGLAQGDKISQITAGEESLAVSSTEELISFNNQHAGEEVTYQIERDGEETAVKITLNNQDAEYVLGVAMAQYGMSTYKSTWSAPIVGAVTTVQLTGETFKGLGELVWNLISGVARQFSPDAEVKEAGRAAISQAGDSVSGPVGIVGVIFPAIAETGLTNIAFLAAVISISLACMNVLPIPALDGGRWFIIALYRIMRKPLDTETEAKIVSRAFMVLFALIIIITVLDILRFFWWVRLLDQPLKAPSFTL